MIDIHSFTFNPFEENTYLLSDKTKECIIIDPGCYEDHEKEEFSDFIEKRRLKPVKLLNTHCHIDHILGNRYVADKYGLGLEINELDLPVLQSTFSVAYIYGITKVEKSPEPVNFLKQGDEIEFGNSKLKVLFVPGHSPGHIVLVSFGYSQKNDTSIQKNQQSDKMNNRVTFNNIPTREQAQKFMITGDVLFYGSIGRTDLPGGNYSILTENIKNKLFTLGDDFQVYTGHGPVTNIGYEKKNNPFLQ